MTRQTGNRKHAKHPLPSRQRTKLPHPPTQHTKLPLPPGEGRGEGNDDGQSVAQHEILEVRERPAAPYLAELQQPRHSREGGNPDTSSGWPRMPLGDLGRWRGGGTPSKANLAFWTNGTTPWVSPKDMKIERIIRTKDYVTEEAVANSATRLIRKGAVIVVVRSGILKHSLPVAIADCDVTLNQDLKAVELKDGVLPEYTAWALRTFAPDILHRCAKTGTTVQNLEMPAFLRYEIPVPPLPQQRRIVAELETQLTRLDASVNALKRAQANLKRYRASVLKAACEGRLVPTEAELARREGRSYESGAELLANIVATRQQNGTSRDQQAKRLVPGAQNLKVLPGGWAWATVEQLSNVVRGASPRPAGDPKYFGGTIPWITVGSITADRKPYLTSISETLTEEGKNRSRFVESQTLLLTNSGATLGVPKITLLDGCINDGVAALLNVDYPLKLYLLYFLHSQTALLRGLNQGAAQPNLNTSIIKAINVPLPPLEEQQRIVAEVERRLSVIEELEVACTVNLKRAARLRQAILCKLFGGANVRRSIQQPAHR